MVDNLLDRLYRHADSLLNTKDEIISSRRAGEISMKTYLRRHSAYEIALTSLVSDFPEIKDYVAGQRRRVKEE